VTAEHRIVALPPRQAHVTDAPRSRYVAHAREAPRLRFWAYALNNRLNLRSR
jgi:hypothetical protein